MPRTYFLLGEIYKLHSEGKNIGLPSALVDLVMHKSRRFQFDPVRTLDAILERFEVMFEEREQHDPMDIEEIFSRTQATVLPWLVSKDIRAAEEIYVFYHGADTLSPAFKEFICSNLKYEIRRVAREGADEVLSRRFPRLDVRFMVSMITNYI